MHDDAQSNYLALLAQDPTNLNALNHLGALLHESGHRTAARTAYAQAVACHPTDPLSRINLANALRYAGDPRAAREHLETALLLSPGHPAAHHALGNVFDDLGDHLSAAHHWRISFTARPIVTQPYRGQSEPIPVLLIATPARGNVQMLHFLHNETFQTHIVYPEYLAASAPLPPHRLAINAVGDSDLCAPALHAAQSLLERTSAPVLNPPSAVLATARAAAAQLFSGIPGLVIPRAATLPRASITAHNLAQSGFAFPLLLRTPGFHTGLHFERVESSAHLPATLSQLPGDQLTVIEYLNASGPDGKSRKYRVMFIDGQIFPLHLAVSNHWKIHYFTADMADYPAHLAEDQAFLEDMPAVLGPRALSALGEIQSRLGLHYAGVDFGLNPSGEVLLFEANATMVVLPPGTGEKWAYRRPAVHRIHAAARDMLLRLASPPA